MKQQFVAPIRRVDTAKSHYYEDANGQRVPGVTTLIGSGVPKPALINWSANSTANYAIDHWDELATMSLSARLKKLQGARYEEKDAAANRGTEVHDLAVPLVQGEEIDVPDAIAEHVESCALFLDEFEPEAKLLEVTVASYKHGYAGTLDAIFWFPTLQKTLLCDWKTNKSGIFGETALQLAGYRFADVYLDADGNEQPMPQVDGCAAIHIRADGYSLIPVTAGTQEHRDLLYAMQVGRFVDKSRDLVGAAVVPPTRLQRRRLEILTPQLESAS